MSLSLREWRRVKELSQQRMADLLSVHVNTYQNWESDPGKISFEKAVEISKILGVSLNDIDFCASKKCS